MNLYDSLGIGIERKGKDYAITITEKNVRQLRWERRLRKLVEDEVILDVNAGREYLEKKGDVLVYYVINLSRFIPKLMKISERIRVYCDLTLLRYGVISTKNFGELFMTYGHDHTRRYGEIYTVLKGEGFLILYSPHNNRTKIVKMVEGDEHYIPPGWVHRMYCGKRGLVLLGFVPYEAGHEYGTVKKKGFPYHIFYDEKKDRFTYIKNRRFGMAELEFVESSPTIGAISRFFGAALELRRLLEKEV